MRPPARTLTGHQYARFHASLSRLQVELQKLLHELPISGHLRRHAHRALKEAGTLSWVLTKAVYADKETSE